MDFSKLGVKGLWQKGLPGAAPVSHLLVVLHGRGDSPRGFEWLQKELGIPGLDVLLLQAPDDYYGGFSWYGMTPDQKPGILRSRILLETVFTELNRQGFASEKIILMGFSQGCLMTLEFGGRHSARLAGYLGISGYVYDVKSLLQEASIDAMSGDWLITHGTEDEVLSVESTRAQISELKRGGFNIEYREFPKTHTIDDQVELPMIREWILKRVKSR